MTKSKFQMLLQNILNTPLFTWVLTGFFISYLFFFIYPIFLSSPAMRFPKYVPAFDTIGFDLNQMLGYSRSWYIEHRTPYVGNNAYPPLASILFTPLLFVRFSIAYKIITLISIASFLLTAIALTLQSVRTIPATAILVFVTGLLSYGFQFELERGQFNVIAVFFCYMAIWIYHYHHKYRYLAYFLFVISVQLKVYPFIFILMLISKWSDWKKNLKRILALSAVNFAIFFILGPQIFWDFIHALVFHSEYSFNWVGNHSIRSYVTWTSKIASDNGLGLAEIFSVFFQLVLLANVATCLFFILLRAYKQKQRDLNSYLFLACSIGALLIPSLSHDYTLSILAAPLALLYSDLSPYFEKLRSNQRIIPITLILVLSIAYSSTLVSYTNKPLPIRNNLPALLLMLIIVSYFSLMRQTSIFNEAPEIEKSA